MPKYHTLYSLSTDQLANFLDDASRQDAPILGVHPTGPAGWIVIVGGDQGVSGPWVALGRADRPQMMRLQNGFPVEVKA